MIFLAHWKLDFKNSVPQIFSVQALRHWFFLYSVSLTFLPFPQDQMNILHSNVCAVEEKWRKMRFAPRSTSSSL